MANDIFSADQPTELNVGLNDLVGEGRKYKDPDELAKAYANIEAHARTLERENADVRAQLDTMQANPNPKPSGDNGREPAPNADPQQTPPNQAPTPKKDDFRAQIREEVAALNEADRAKANIEASAQKMVEVYGSTEKANEAVQNRAKELGVSVEWLRDSASRSPEAFYASMGIASRSSSSSTPASGQGIHLDNRGASMKNFEYFDKIRKEDPKTYFSAATQQEMLREAKAQGSDFYKR